MFAQTGFDIWVGDWMRRADGTTGWDLQKRPLPENLTLLKKQSEAVQILKTGACDTVICHTLQDLAFVAPFDVPTVYLTHNALQNDGMNDHTTMAKLQKEIGSFLTAHKGIFAAISPMKLNSWGLDGFIVRPGINLNEYGGYVGDDARALSVGNLFVERDHMLGFRYLKNILENVPRLLVGENPKLAEAKKAENWETLKKYFRQCRVYVNTTVEAFEDGYNLGMLEAMATGMPVVCLANGSSPIVDGVNGYISEDTGYLQDRVLALLKDQNLAKKLGDQARKTVAKDFSVQTFVETWHKIVDASVTHFANHTVVNKGDMSERKSVHLATPKDALFPYEWKDVVGFLSVDNLDDITVAKLKLDRMGAGYLCDIFLGNKKTKQTMAWQGLEVFVQDPIQITWPAYLARLDNGIRQVIEGAVRSSVEQVEKGQMGDAQSIHVNLGGGDAFEFRVGEDRVTPGDARSDIYLHHAKRYTFARQFCAGKSVVDLGSGAGYGAKILKRDAARVVGLDLEPDAQRFGNRVFGDANICRLVGDIRAVGLSGNQFDVAVCFEAMEHVREHDDLLGEVRRLLKADGTLVISTPNKKIYDLPANANDYHVGMLELDEFQDLLTRYYEDVVVYGQMCATTTQPFYEAFDFRNGVDDGDEVFVAVCKKPRAQVWPRKQPEAPAIHVRAGDDKTAKGERRLKVLISHVSNPISMGRYYVDAFSKVHDVMTCGPVIDADELKQWRVAEEQHAFKSIEAAQVEKLDLIERLATPCDIPMARGQVDIGQVLDQLPKGWRPDLMMWIDSATGFLPMGLEKLDCPTVCLSVDTHTGQIDWRMKYAKMFSHTYLVHNQFIDQFKAAGCPFVGWLPSACAPDVHGKIAAHKSYEIGFVGQTHRQWHPHRVRLLERLKKAGFDVHIESKILQEMALFNSRSKILFNRSLNGDLNMRVFESLCSGSMLLTDRLEDNALLNNLFQDREHLVLYDDNNLEELVRYYLDHEDEREAIARAGREAVLSGHTYAHRADLVIAEVVAKSGIAHCVLDAESKPTPLVSTPKGNASSKNMLTIPRGAGDVESAIAELVAYTGESLEVVKAKLPTAGEALTAEWRSAERKNETAVDAFYQETEHFIYDLTHFNYANMYMGWRGAVYNLCQQVSDAMPAFEVLDYGGGIGTSLLELSDLPGIHLTYADLPGKTYDYANWRFQQRGLNVRSIALGDDDPLAGRLFDVIVCMEVIEHLVEPEQVVKYLIDHLKPGGLLILTVTFYAPEPDMMHLNLDRYTNDGFYQIVQDMGMTELTKFSPRIFKKGGQQSAVSSQQSAVSGQQQKTIGDPSAGEKFKQLLREQKGPVRLNLGCGEDRRAGYINVDAYVPTADLQMDIFDLKMDDGVVDEIFSSHMLEHLGKYEVPKVLTEWHRVLKPGGVLCLNLPDLEWSMTQWLRTPEEHRWGWALDTIYGLQTHGGEYHKTGFTVARAEQLMEQAGFAQVKVSWTWSHGLRCLWVEAIRPEVGMLPGVIHAVEMNRFAHQFPVEMSDLVPYSKHDVASFFAQEWQMGFVSFEKLPMDGADLTLNVAVVSQDRQMVLQGIRIFGLKQNPFVIYPAYLQDLAPDIQQQLSKSIGDALGAKLKDPNYKDGAFVIARFGQRGDLGLEQTGERVIPGLTDYSLYIPHMKRYLLAETFAKGARVLDAGCGTGYGSKRLTQVADRVDAVDLDAETIAFAKRTYADERVTWSVGDVRSLDVEAGIYDLVTSFEVIEHLRDADIADYLKGLHRALKVGGVALISTPNKKVAAKWKNPHHKHEMTLDEFQLRLKGVFGDVTILGQTEWSNKIEVSGQCAISGRVSDDDDMYIAVCKKREVYRVTNDDFHPKVSIVMPLFNKADYTKACLEGLEKTRADVPFEVVLVDNGSSDGTGDLLHGVADKMGYCVIRNGENLGFSRGNNVGAQRALGEYVLFLNNDTVPHLGWLEAMVAELEGDPSVGIVGAKLLYPDTGKIQHAGLEIVNGTPDHVHRHASADAPEVNVVRDLDMVTGACLLIRKEIFDHVGGFDEGYVNGVEDVDLCLRVRDLGYRVKYTPKAVVDHYEGTSDGRYDHVRPNLERFVKRWNGRFGADGRFVPKDVQKNKTTTMGVFAGVLSKKPFVEGKLVGVWEGTQFVYHSLSIVNMALTSELIRAGCELKLVPYEPATFGPEKDPKRLEPIAERLNAALSGPAQFHVRHQWPPNFTPPPEGHWVMIQPWEFGQIPQEWVKPMQEKVDEIWVPSEYVKQCYVDSGIDAGRVQVIPNGVRTDLMRPEAKPLKLDTDKTFKFLFVGGTIFRKGIDVLLKVYHQTFSASDDVCLVIKGMGDDTFYKGQTAGELIKQIQDDPDGPEVLYLTEELSEKEMAGLYTACDCLVHPYRGEGFGMPVAEAMACGLPVVVTEGGACDDFCSEENAYFVSAKRRHIRMSE